MATDPGTSPGIWGGMIGGLVVACVGMYTASKRKWIAEKDLSQVKHWTEFPTPYTEEQLLPWMQRYAAGSRLIVEEMGVAPDRIVLGEKPNGSHYGYFYPIVLTPLPAGGTLVRIGALSRYGMLSSSVAQQLKRVAKRLQGALALPPPSAVGSAQNPWAGGAR